MNPRRTQRWLAGSCCLVAVALGAAAQVAFPPPVNVSLSSDGSYVPSLVIPSSGPASGVAQVYWHDFTGPAAGAAIWCASEAGSGWLVEGPCPPSGAESQTPRAAVDSQGVVHLAWRDPAANDIYHAQLEAGAWSVPEVVAATPGTSRNPAIAVDRWDLAHLMWEDDSTGVVRLWESHFDGVAWSPGADSGLPYALGAFVDVARLACDSTGTLHVAWHDGLTSLTEIHHAARPPGGSWSPRENVSATPGSLSAEPALAFAPDDTLHCAWVEQDPVIATVFEICHASLPPAGAWSPRLDVSRQLSQASRPSLAVGADGQPRIAWSFQTATGTEIAYIAFPGDVPSNVSRTPGVGSTRPSLALDADDEPWIAWQEGVSTPAEILATTTATPAPPALLLLAKDRAVPDALLTWTGGRAPFRVLRAPAPEPAGPWAELTPVGGIAAAAWSDAGVLSDGATWFYLVE